MGRKLKNRQNTGWVAIPFLIVGGVLLMDRIGFYFPDWFFQWEMIVILVGLFIGFKDGFRHGAWLVIVAVGAFFLIDDFIPHLRLGRFILPVIFLGVGFLILTRSKADNTTNENPPPVKNDDNISDYGVRTETDEIFPEDKTAPEEKNRRSAGIPFTDNILEVVSIFGNVRKNIMSKNFRGGEIVTVFGGADINLIHADFNETTNIEAVNIFGGTKLFIPSSWEVKSEVVSIFGGVEDKRHFSSLSVIPEKTLVLQGFCMFGGIEIKSYNR
ncbi:LiaF transmembrane domain-containing protein [Pollutibacter soli]|uniref:LiaF transmembrane domain-containing protein n=1 Tax=Pollutibacter soli TaxID=3034157 RepID=UPI003013548B